MPTQVSPQTRQTVDNELERLKKENEALKSSSRIVHGRMYPPNDKHPKIWKVRLMEINPITKYPVRDGSYKGTDGKEYAEYKTFEWLDVEETDLLSAANGEKRSVNLYFNKSARKGN